MRKSLFLAALALPLAACATSPYGYGGYNSNPLGAILGSIGTLGSGYGQSGYGYNSYGYGYGGGFSQAAASACANYASRFGAVRVTNVRQTDSNRMRVRGYVSRGFGSDDWSCTFRADGRIGDFDI